MRNIFKVRYILKSVQNRINSTETYTWGILRSLLMYYLKSWLRVATKSWDDNFSDNGVKLTISAYRILTLLCLWTNRSWKLDTCLCWMCPSVIFSIKLRLTYKMAIFCKSWHNVSCYGIKSWVGNDIIVYFIIIEYLS